MSIKIKELPELERPYEKLEMYGEKALSNAELLAIIIKTGTKKETSVAIAQKILKLNNTKEEDLNFIQTLSIAELMQIKGIGKVKAIQLKAVGEIAIRMFKKTNFKKERDEWVKLAVLHALILLGEKEYFPIFLQAIHDEDYRNRLFVLNSLEDLEISDCKTEIINHLKLQFKKETVGHIKSKIQTMLIHLESK